MKALKPKLLGNWKPNTVTVEINHWNTFKGDTKNSRKFAKLCTIQIEVVVTQRQWKLVIE
jgi:hypothetical protein